MENLDTTHESGSSQGLLIDESLPGSQQNVGDRRPALGGRGPTAAGGRLLAAPAVSGAGFKFGVLKKKKSGMKSGEAATGDRQRFAAVGGAEGKGGRQRPAATRGLEVKKDDPLLGIKFKVEQSGMQFYNINFSRGHIFFYFKAYFFCLKKFINLWLFLINRIHTMLF